MTARSAWRWCFLAGLATMIISTAFGWIAGLAPCGPSSGLGSIMAFELARNPAEIAALFGNEPCRSVLTAAQVKGLLLDGLAFIPSYGGFLGLAALALRTTGPRWAGVALVAVLAAMLLDEIEGGLLYAILRDLPGTPGVIGALYWEARTKFLLLAAAAAIIAWLLGAGRRPAGMIAALPIGAGALWSLWYVATDMHSIELMRGYLLSWTALLVVALIACFWPRAFSTDS
jgi:hypothetical protein